MRKNLFWPSDEQWARIGPYLPRDVRGVERVDDRRVISGIVHVLNPLQDASADTVVTTWTLCSIPAVLDALHEIRRVLRPTGRLLFVEHGQAPDPNVRWWQDRLTPLWRRIGGGLPS
jgi:ubiquinone/menaquinone biosynthesis C-methylase UbiE